MTICMTVNAHVTDIEIEMRSRDAKGHYIKEKFNDHEIHDNVVRVFTESDAFYIDLDDLPLVSQYRWRINYARKETNTQKAYRRVETSYNGRPLKLHRLLLNAKSNQIVDHKDQNPLNNCRNNLRTVTASQNQRNRKARKNSSSQFKGCYFDKNRQLWAAQIRVNEKTKSLGRFKTELEANNAYKEAELKYFGDSL